VDSNRGIFSPENLVEIADSMALGGMGGATIGTASGIARNALSYERKIDETADAAAREVKARGGDALDAENARTAVYNDLDVEFVRPDIADIQRQNNFDPATGQPITPPAVPEGIPFKPPQSPGLSMADMEQQPRQDQGIDFNTAPRKAEAIERAQQQYQQAKEDVSLESIALPQPESVPAEPADYLPALPALEEREQEAIGQLERQARNLEKAKPKPVPARGRQVEPDMELSTAVAVAGGINIDEARSQGLDPQSRRDRVGIRPIFTRKGQSLDGMAETLNQYGFRDEQGNELTANSLLDELDRSLSGQEVYSTANTGLPAERQAVDRDIEEIDRQIDAIRQHYTDDERDPPKAKALTDATDIERELDYAILEADLLMPQDRVNGIINAADSDQGALQALRKEIDNVRGRNTQPAGPEARTGPEAPSQGERASQEAGRPADAREAPERGQFGPESERDGRLGPEVGGGGYRVGGERDSGAVQGQNQAEEFTGVDQAAHEAATSPENALAEPSEAQKSAGNYRKGHLSLHGLDISIENPRGSKRSGTAPDGRKWERTLAHHYGYFKRSEGRDGDQVDLFLTQNAEDADRPVFVIDQVNPQTGRFDEHKTVVGAATEAEAREAYLANYEDGWKGLGAISSMTLDEFHALPDDPNVDRELVFGELVERPMTKLNKWHSGCESRIASLLDQWCRSQSPRPGKVFSGEAGCDLPEIDTGVGIDVAFFSQDVQDSQSDESIYIVGPPVLAVEILSLSDVVEDTHRKVKAYLAAGVQQVWIRRPLRQDSHRPSPSGTACDVRCRSAVVRRAGPAGAHRGDRRTV